MKRLGWVLFLAGGLATSCRFSGAGADGEAGAFQGGAEQGSATVTDLRDARVISFVRIGQEGELSREWASWNEVSTLPTGPVADPDGTWFESELARARYRVERAGQGIVAACKGAQAGGQSAEVDTERREDCGHGRTFFNKVKYRLERSSDGIEASLRIRFKNGGMAWHPDGIDEHAPTTPERFDEMVVGARKCSAVVERVWGRYGLNVRADFDSERDPLFESPDHEVTLLDGTGRSSAGHYYYQDSFPVDACERYYCGQDPASCQDLCEATRTTVFCQTVLHETGHLLGLPDEYEDSACPGRTGLSSESEPWSVMAYAFLSASQVEFFPRHVRAVIAPICP